MTELKLDFLELKKLSREDLVEDLQKRLEDYKLEIAQSITEYESAQKEEGRVIEAIDAFQEYLEGMIYKFTGGVTIEGKPIKNSEVFKYIQYFLNKMEVEYQYTKGLKDMYNFWGANPVEVSYSVMESTLRTLQTCKFKGVEEWTKIMAINDFFANVRGESIKDTAFQMFYAQIHTAIIDRAELLRPASNAVPTPENESF